MDSDRYVETWRKYRRAWVILLTSMSLAVMAHGLQWLFHPPSDLRDWSLLLTPAVFWSVWRLESLPCPRCGKRFINLLRQANWFEHARCRNCGLEPGATGDAT